MAIEGVARQLDRILHDYVEKVDETTDEIMASVAKETVAELKRTSPNRNGKGGAYARSWAVKKVKHQFIVHNKKHYRLTHLLNNGHIIRNQYGTYGRVPGDNHIGKAEERANTQLIKELEAKL